MSLRRNFELLNSVQKLLKLDLIHFCIMTGLHAYGAREQILVV